MTMKKGIFVLTAVLVLISALLWKFTD